MRQFIVLLVMSFISMYFFFLYLIEREQRILLECATYGNTDYYEEPPKEASPYGYQ